MFKKKITESEMAVYQFDPLTGFAGRPNAELDVAFEGAAGPVIKVRLNDLGQRDEAFSVKKGIKNVLCYGGSHTWGAFVEQDKRYTDVLNRRSLDCRFVNLGDGSFGLDQICLSILKRSQKYSPSVFVIEQYPWAVHRVLNSYVEGYLKPSFYIDAQGELKLRKVPFLARYKFYRKMEGAYRLYKKEFNEFKGGVDIKSQYDPLTDPIFLRWKSSYYEPMYDLNEQILRVIKGHCEQNRCKLLFMTIPYLQQFGQESGSDLIDLDLPSKRFIDLLEKLKIEYINTAPILVGSHTKESPAIKADGHTNDKGHALLADALAEGLISRGWIKNV